MKSDLTTKRFQAISASPPPAHNMFCFAPDTEIATPEGPRAVKTLAPGDLVLKADGRAVPMTWLGQMVTHRLFMPEEQFRPVRIAAGARPCGGPYADLMVTPDHGILVDGLLCSAGALVNGTTITRVPMAELGQSETYWHVETAEREVLLANGAPTASYLETRSVSHFTNRDARPGAVMTEQPYPRAMSTRQVPPRVQNALAARHCA